MSSISPENFTDAQLEAMTMGQLSKVFKNCEDWISALKAESTEWIEYCILGGRVWAIMENRWNAAKREMRNPDGNWRNP